MNAAIRKWIAPTYLFLCLVAGGSAQGVWANAVLQLAAIAIIAWAALAGPSEPAARGARQLAMIIALALLLAAVQLMPLPAGLWTALPGRGTIAEGLALLGVAPGRMPLSLAPYDGLATLTTLLPPLALLAAVVRFGCRSSWVALSVVAATAAAVLLGVLQVAGPSSPASPWYLYPISNFGVATGFFANSNHMATLLLVAVPFAVALGATARGWTEDARKRGAGLAVMAGSLIVILVGLALNGSLAGYGLILPVAIASLLLVVRPRTRWVRAAALGVGALGLVAFVVLIATPLNERFVTSGAATSLSTRQEVFAQSVEAYRAYGPAGSGLGSFSDVYRMFENPARVDRTFVNHAHNDYLELAVEMGLAGVALILLFLAWWGRTAWQVTRSQAYDQYAVAGAIASGAILVHSLVDFPLRTAAVSALFAASLALMIVSKRKVGRKDDLRPTRHLVID